MAQIGLWRVTDAAPQRLKVSNIDLEKYLEDWIEKDPSLLQDGLTIVGRQVGVEGGRLDLLALDAQGRWVIVEIKCGAVRRETVAQVLDYASCIAVMPFEQLLAKVDGYLSDRSTTLQVLLEERGAEETAQAANRELTMFVVGTGKDPGLERVIAYLTDTFEVPITAVLFDVFELEDGQRILVREMSEAEVRPADEGRKAKVTVEDVCRVADQHGIGQDFRRILGAGQKHNLYPRPYATSIMYTSPVNRARMLFTVWAKPKVGGRLKVYIGPAAFAQFYPIEEEMVVEILGQGEGWVEMSSQEIDRFLSDLDRLFQLIQAKGIEE